MNMSIKKDRVMQELQRFGGAMYTPVILFAFFGLTVAISIVCKNTMLLGSIADKGTGVCQVKCVSFFRYHKRRCVTSDCWL